MLDELKRKFDKVKLKHIIEKKNRRNGKTIAVIHDGDMRYVGISECGKNDCFSKKTGRRIALGRAIKAKTSGNQNGVLFSFDINNEAISLNIPKHLLY